MGSSKSKSANKTSYDVAPVVSSKEIKYEKPNETMAAPTPASTSVPVLKEEETKFDPKLVPTWVTEERFAELLREHNTNFEKIIKFKAYPALTTGENYATLMLRVSIDIELKDGSKEHVSYMLKVPHNCPEMREKMKVANVFLPENSMYLDIIPELEKSYKEAGLPVTFAPKAFRFPTDPDDDYVLLEDLCTAGFKNVNRWECFDMKHTLCVLKKMAQFHAVSACHVATKGPLIDIIMNGIQNETGKALWQGVMSSFQAAFMRHINTYKDGEKYRKEVENKYSGIVDDMLAMNVYDPDAFNVVNHGDSWCNNMLFKHTPDGDIAEMRYVDFQIAKYGSPAQDLLYFIMSSVNIEIKLKQFDHFIRYYHDHLTDYLTLLKYPKLLPTLREIHMQLIKNGSWAFVSSMMILPVVLLDPTEIAHIDNFISDSDTGAAFKNAMFSNKRYRTYIEEILPWLYNRGLMEPDVHAQKKEKVSEVPAVESDKSAIKSEQVVAKSTSSGAFDIPSWVSKEYFVDVLKENVKGFAGINTFEARKGTSGGDNYASLMLQVDIEARLEDGSSKPVLYMLKIEPAGEQAQAMSAIFDTFAKELATYEEVIPQLERIYKEAGVSDVIFAPKMYKFSKNPGCKTVLLENMRQQGFKNADRRVGLDLIHTENVLSKLAQYHAASAYWLATGVTLSSAVRKNLYSEESRVIMEPMTAMFFALLIDALKTYEGSEAYEEKILKYKAGFYDLLLKSSTVDEAGFNVINHGDCWTNNILFQYNPDGSIKNTYFIDYQITAYGSPAQDLYYFLMSSPTLDIKLNTFDQLIEFYHKNLKQNLELLKYPKDIPSLADIQKDLMKFGGWAFATVVGVMAAVLLEPSEDANMENMLSDDAAGAEIKKRMYTNELYSRHAVALFPWLNERGLMDIA